MNNNDCIDLENVANADSKCPWCGAEVDGYEELTFVNYGKSGCGIEVTNHCDSCGTSYTLVYHLGEAVRDE